jgi:ribonuclease Z
LKAIPGAAVQTYWRIPELKIGFDLGAQPVGLHEHAHLADYPYAPGSRCLSAGVYSPTARMMRMEPPAIYLPAECLEWTQRLLRVWQHLDRGRLTCQLHGVSPGDEIELTREYVIGVFRTAHTVPSVGYLVWNRRHKLKPEYHGLPGEKIRDLRLSGVEVTREVRTPVLAYTGDTSPEVFDLYPNALRRPKS